MREMRGTLQAETPSAVLKIAEGVLHINGSDSLGMPEALSKGARGLCGDVLLLGRDDSLQHTRASLLERVGFRCYLARGADEALCMARNDFDVTVLCHTLPLVEARDAAELIRLRFPSTKVLRLALYSQAVEACFERLLVLPSPSVFVATVQHLSLTAGCNA